MKNKIKFYSVVLAQVLVLVLMIISNLIIINTGEKILLKTRPIDPRSLFSGDYVTLSYDIERINLHGIKNADPLIKQYIHYYITSPLTGRNLYESSNVDVNDLKKHITNKDAYIILSKNKGEEYYSADSITFDKPKTNKTFIKGNVEYINVMGNNYSSSEDDIEAEISINYKSIDTYYVPEGTGHELEQQFRDDRERHLVEVSIDKNGNGRVVGIK